MKSDTAILIAARDSYSDTWPAFFGLLFRYWPDCPYPIYLFSEGKTFPDPRVLPLLVSADTDRPWLEQWTSRMREGISRIGAERLIVLHTDYFLSEPIDTARIKRLDDLLRRDGIGCIRLCPVPPPKIAYPEDSSLGIIAKSDKYSVSFQAAIWKRGVLEFFLKPEWTPAECESEGSKQSYHVDDLFLSAWKESPALPYVHGISKDTWLYEAIRHLEREGFGVAEGRKREGLAAYLSRKLFIKMLWYRIKLSLGWASR